MKYYFIFFLIIFSSSTLGCDEKTLDYLEKSAQNNVASNNIELGLTELYKIIECFPFRGDIRLELVRAHLQINQITLARVHQNWLIEHNAPEGILNLTEAWIKNKETFLYHDHNKKPQPQSALFLSIATGYNANANEATSNTSIPIEIEGTPLVLSITENAKPSTYYQAAINYQFKKDTNDFFLGARSQHFDSLNEYENTAFMGGGHYYQCFNNQKCDLSLHTIYQNRGENTQYIFQLGKTFRPVNRSLGIHYRYIAKNNESNSDSIGLDWRLNHNNWIIQSTIEYDKPREFRPGDAKTKLMVNLQYKPYFLNNSIAYINNQYEKDSSVYAPIFWKDRVRHRHLIRAGFTHNYLISPQLSLQSTLNWQKTHSNIALFEQQGWSIGLEIIWRGF